LSEEEEKTNPRPFWLNEKHLALGTVLLRQESKGAAALS
jgi:hypothetical protein